MKSACALVVVVSLVASSVPLAAQEVTRALSATASVIVTPGPIARAIVDKGSQLGREIGFERLPARESAAQAPPASKKKYSRKRNILSGIVYGAIPIGFFMWFPCAMSQGSTPDADKNCTDNLLGGVAIGAAIGGTIGAFAGG
jgi:hypothetical protein